jgi:hypothetical protein
MLGVPDAHEMGRIAERSLANASSRRPAVPLVDRLADVEHSAG